HRPGHTYPRQAAGEWRAGVDSWNSNFVIRFQVGVRLISVQPEARYSHSNFAQQTWAEGVGVIQCRLLAARVSCLRAQAASRGSSGHRSKKRRVIEQAAQVCVTNEKLVPVGDVPIVPNVELIGIEQGRTAARIIYVCALA